MPVNKCRVCKAEFFEEPILRYENMPKAAQFLPDTKSLTKEKGVDLEVYQCSGCGLVQLSSEPVHYYKEVIRAAAFSDEMKNFRIQQFRSFKNKYSLENKKVVEIGCGRGEYLSLLQQVGVNAFGLESSYQSVKQSQKKGLNVSRGFVDGPLYKIEKAPFDAFLILNFLEHLPDPNSTLKGINNNLSAEAVGLVEAPNFDMILQKKMFSEFIGDHLFYFTKETLQSTLKINGFEILECQEIWHDYILSAVVKKRTKLNLSDFNNYRFLLKKEIDEFIQRYEKKRVAVWGAGHQALANISLLNLADKIKYVVDSAAFKQGKFTPATHLPIVSPDKLISEPVDAIIVMAASYSDEVVRILQEKYHQKITISVLRDFGLEIL